MKFENPAADPSVLIVRLGAMGDVLHALPAVAMVRRAMPDARIGWVVERRWRELLCAPGDKLAGPRGSGRPLVDALHLVDTRKWRKHPLSAETRYEFQNMIRELHEQRYDAAIDFQGAIKSAVLARLSGAGIVLGFRHPRERVARYFYSSLTDERAPHVIEQNMELVQNWMQELGFARAVSALSPGTALLPRDDESERRLNSTLRSLGNLPIAILNPGAGWGAKQWAPARYGELARALAARGLQPVVNYGPGEEDLAREAVRASENHAVEFSGSLSDLIALARRARLFVGGDTGPMHLAALLGVKTVALFGPTDPARNGPYWAETRVLRDPASVTSYCHRKNSDLGLANITVEQVLAEIESLLD